MGAIRECKPVLLLIAAFAASEEAMQRGKELAEREFGPIALESKTYRFDDFTPYYAKEMGEALPKRFWVFQNLIDPGVLADIKRQTNEWEAMIDKDLFINQRAATPRPLNLDPGYIELGKLILASTKDHAHRIYLRDGIFAETTLMYSKKDWQALPWSYADYQDKENQAFFTQCREYLKTRYQLLALKNAQK